MASCKEMFGPIYGIFYKNGVIYVFIYASRNIYLIKGHRAIAKILSCIL